MLKRTLVGCLLVIVIYALIHINGSLPSAAQEATSNKNRSLKKTQDIKLKPSPVIEDIKKKFAEQPNIEPHELASFGNELIRRDGFNYEFNACDYLKETKQYPDQSHIDPEAKVTFNCPLMSTEGKGVTVHLTADNFGGLCSECLLPFALIQVTKREMMVVADGKWYRLNRPKSFALDEAYLVDDSLENVQRTWQLPYQTIPVGISRDGTRLFVAFYDSDDLDQLVLEITDVGVQFRARDEAISNITDEWVTDHQSNSLDSYLAYKRFYTRGGVYVVRFSSPCT